MTEPTTPSRGKRRLLLAGAGVGGPLIGLLLLMTVFAGNDPAALVAPAAARAPAQTTTVPVPVPTTSLDEASILATASDPFRQLVTGPDTSQSPDATKTVGDSTAQPGIDGVRDAGAVAGAPLTDDPAPSVDSEPAGVATGEGAGVPPAVSAGVPPAVTDETVSQAPAPETISSPPTTELPVPTTSMSAPSTLPPVTSTVAPSMTTTVPPATSTTSTTSTTSSTSTTSTTAGPPGRGIVFAGVKDGNQDIYTIDAVGGGQRRLTYGRAADREPAWSPDGTKIAFVSDRVWRPELFVMRADGTSQTRVTASGGSPAKPTWGRDGESLVFESTEVATGSRELFVVTLRTGVVRRLTSGACAGSAARPCPDGDIAHGQPASSLDGTRIAFVRTDRTGQHLLVMNADGSDIRSLGGTRAANPAWAADGRDIAYDDVDGIRVVSAGGGPHEVVDASSFACPPAIRCPVFFEPSWSPDGTRLTVRDGKTGTTTGDLYVIELRGPQQTRLIAGAQASGPQWFSPRAPGSS